MHNYMTINHCNTLLGRFSLAQKGVMEDADDNKSQKKQFSKTDKNTKVYYFKSRQNLLLGI